MGLINDLTQSQMDELRELVESLVRQSVADFTSVQRGSFRILSPEGFYVGGEASATIAGLLTVTGPDGQVIIHGTLHSDGAVTFDDTLVVKAETTLGQDGGLTHIVGPTNLDADLTVQNPGKILVGTGVRIEPGAGGGKITVSGLINMLIENGMITFDSGAVLQGEAGGAKLDSGTAAVAVGTGTAGLVSGPNAISVSTATGVTITGDPAAALAVLLASSFFENVQMTKNLDVVQDITGNRDVYLPNIPTSSLFPTGVLGIDPADGKVKVGA
ncbi:hypothetical protein BH09ACT9_BH09ACT9_00770 [soil metagenome]